MNIPFQFGLPQIILLLISLCGFLLFVYAAHSLIRGERLYKLRSEEEKEAYRQYGRLPRRRRLRWQHGLGGILLLFVAISLLWMTFLIQSYLGLTGNIEVAQVRATNVANPVNSNIPMMSVELTLFDQNGHTASDQTYLVLGNEWMVQGDIIKFPDWLNVVGLHTGYKLTRMEGRYDDPNLEANGKHTVVTLNGGDDGFFQHTKGTNWYSNFVQAQYGNAVFQSADGATYNIFVSQTGLYALKAGT
ncbi:MAG TPA: hypothetical protein VGM01_03110 [Ktedonobacteraceae bacterium]